MPRSCNATSSYFHFQSDFTMNSQVVRAFGVGHNKPASDFYLFIFFFLIQHIYSETEIVSSRKTLQREKKKSNIWQSDEYW